MKAGAIHDLKGNFGSIQHDFIWETVEGMELDTLILPAPQATKADLDYVRLERKLHVGLIFSPDWYANAPGAMFAEIASRKLDEVQYGNTVCTIVLDNERHGSSDVLNMLAHWRHLRPTRDTIWCPEPMQGGDMSVPLRKMILEDAHLRVCPQLYGGDMTPFSERAVHEDLRWILDPTKRLSVYGVVSQTTPTKVKLPVPQYWNGILFSLDYLLGL